MIKVIVIHTWLEYLILAKHQKYYLFNQYEKQELHFVKKVTPKFIDKRYIKMVIYSINNAVN